MKIKIVDVPVKKTGTKTTKRGDVTVYRPDLPKNPKKGGKK